MSDEVVADDLPTRTRPTRPPAVDPAAGYVTRWVEENRDWLAEYEAAGAAVRAAYDDVIGQLVRSVQDPVVTAAYADWILAKARFAEVAERNRSRPSDEDRT
jgi:hypothetical protein